MVSPKQTVDGFEGLFIIDALACPVSPIEGHPVLCADKIKPPVAGVNVAADIRGVYGCSVARGSEAQKK